MIVTLLRKFPQSLEEISFEALLEALDQNLSSPTTVPQSILVRALENKNKLKDVTIIRIIEEASKSGLKEINVNENTVNPIFIRQIFENVEIHASKLTKLSVNFSNALMTIENIQLLRLSLMRMTNLEDLSLIGVANDGFLQDLGMSKPPLTRLDISQSKLVSDTGIQSLLNNYNTLGSHLPLQYFNIYETKVTTRGCIQILKHSNDLRTLVSEWVPESLIVMEMKQSDATKLEELSINRGHFEGTLNSSVLNICPNLRKLTLIRPNDEGISLNSLLSDFEHLECLSLVHFVPIQRILLSDAQICSQLRQLYLSPCAITCLNLKTLAKVCPLLSDITLDSIEVICPSEQLKIPQNKSNIKFVELIRLKIIYKFNNCKSIDPETTMRILEMCEDLESLQLDTCELIEDQHFLSLLDRNYLSKIEEITLTSPVRLTENLIYSLARSCFHLKRLTMKRLPSKQRKSMEEVSAALREANAQLELVTFTNKSFNEIM